MYADDMLPWANIENELQNLLIDEIYHWCADNKMTMFMGGWDQSET